MRSLNEFFRTSRFIVLTVLLIGILLTVIPEVWPNHVSGILASIVAHFGIALMIASVIGFIFELTEIKDFFEKRLTTIFQGNEFLTVLHNQQLRDISRRAMEIIIRRKVTDPEYDTESLPRLMTDTILSLTGQTYYEGYHGTIEHTILTPEEVRKLDTAEPIEKEVVRLSIETRLFLVPPKINEEVEHELPYWWSVKRISGLDKYAHCQITLEVGGEKQPINVDASLIENGKKIEIDLRHKVKLFRPTLVVWKAVFLEYGQTGSLTCSVESLTHNLSVHFSSGKPLELEAEIFGMTTTDYPPSVTKNSVTITYPYWLLPGHGYYILWTGLD